MPVMMRRRPIAKGETMAWAGLISAGSGGASRAPADRYQPRLAGWLTCLTAIFEDRCVLCVASFLWKR